MYCCVRVSCVVLVFLLFAFSCNDKIYLSTHNEADLVQDSGSEDGSDQGRESRGEK